MLRLDKDGGMFTNGNVASSSRKPSPSKFRLWTTRVSLILAAALLTIAVTLGIQDHDDRLLAAQMTQSEAALKATGSKIADLKDHEFKTMVGYVSAYSQVEPLLNEYDHQLQAYANLCDTAERKDQTRWLINFHRHQYHPEVWRNASEITELIHQINSIVKKEAAVIRDMSALPEQEQLQFWHEEFMPLLAEEHALRERLLLAGQRVSPQLTLQ